MKNSSVSGSDSSHYQTSHSEEASPSSSRESSPSRTSSWQSQHPLRSRGAGQSARINNRSALEDRLSTTPGSLDQGTYQSSVRGVNLFLANHLPSVSLSDSMLGEISENIRQTSEGTMLHSHAASKEGRGFLRDAIASNKNLESRVGSLVGGVLNTTISPMFHAQEDMRNYVRNENQTAETRAQMQTFIAGNNFPDVTG